jgi:hypothetical protein
MVDLFEPAAAEQHCNSPVSWEEGMYFLQTGPGFTRRQLAPSQSPLAPRVLHFADTYEPDNDSDDDSAIVDGDD